MGLLHQLHAKLFWKYSHDSDQIHEEKSFTKILAQNGNHVFTFVPQNASRLN